MYIHIYVCILCMCMCVSVKYYVAKVNTAEKKFICCNFSVCFLFFFVFYFGFQQPACKTLVTTRVKIVTSKRLFFLNLNANKIQND